MPLSRPPRPPTSFGVLDKLEKVGLDKVKKELTTGYTDASGDPIRGLGLADNQVAKIDQFLAISWLNPGRRLVEGWPNSSAELKVLKTNWPFRGASRLTSRH